MVHAKPIEMILFLRDDNLIKIYVDLINTIIMQELLSSY